VIILNSSKGEDIHKEGGIMKRLVTLTIFFLFLTLPVLSQASSWQIDPDHSSFQFKVRHLMVSNVKGDFTKTKGVVTMDDNDRANLKIDLTIDAASVNTGHAKRDEHLRAPDFFDVAKYPTITFVSKKVTKDGPDKLKVVGDLTIHGVTKEVTVDVEGPTQEIKDPWGNFRRGATATTRINRKDFGLTWNRALETGGVVVGEDVDIFVEIELIKK
jgi:polyisoprenoid-binding protein YceI